MTSYPNQGNNFQPEGSTPAQLAMYERVARQVWACLNKGPWEVTRDEQRSACYLRAAVILETIQDAGYEIVSRVGGNASLRVSIAAYAFDGVEEVALATGREYFGERRFAIEALTATRCKDDDDDFPFHVTARLRAAEGTVGRLSPEDVESDREARL